MFSPKPWARAFMNCAAANAPASSASAEACLEALEIYCKCAEALPGNLSGKADAGQLEKLLENALAGTDLASGETVPGFSGAAELARRFFLLMVKRGCFHHHEKIIMAIEKSINNKKGISDITLETAFMVDDDFLAAVRKRV
jgi:hypothetical protein